MNEIFDLAVIGGGPAGYVCSIKASQLGLKVACIESRTNLGGTCLNEGCIPSKALLHSSHYYEMIMNGKMKDFGIHIRDVELSLKDMMSNKDAIVSKLAKGIDYLFKKNGVVKFCGDGRIISHEGEIKKINVNGTEKKTILTKNIVVATGSESSSIPGINFDKENIISSTEALSLTKIPKKMVVVGGGVIGLEMSSIWSRLGSEVTVIEYCEKLAPFLDVEVSAYMQNSLEKQHIKFLTGTKVNSIIVKNCNTEVHCTNVTSGETKNIITEKVLVAIGRTPRSKNIGAPIATDEKGFILTNHNFETNIKSIYAIGDVTVGPMLAHKAEEEGVIVAEIISGKKFHHNGLIPAVIYTHPEVAYVGKNEQSLQKEGIKYKVGKFPFIANSRAITNNDTDGFVKILANEFGTILGVHIISSQASTLIGEAVVAMEYSASTEDLSLIIHSHPDLNEAIKEAAMMALFDKALSL